MTQNQKQNGISIILGVVPIIALTDTTLKALSIGVITLIVLFLSGIVFLLFAKCLKEPSRTLILIIVTGTITTVITEVLSYRLPELYNNLDVFVPLIAINSFVLYHLRYDSDQKAGLKMLFVSVKKWFVIVCLIFVVSIFREILGLGTFFNRPMIGPDLETSPRLLVNAPPGALMTTAVVLMLFHLVKKTDK